MKMIWKYKLAARTVQTIQMPVGAQILTAQFQRDEICLWAMVDEVYQAFEGRKIEVLGTGESAPEAKRKHIGTVQTNNGDLVFHVFERL